jgi:hypothetical protein
MLTNLAIRTASHVHSLVEITKSADCPLELVEYLPMAVQCRSKFHICLTALASTFELQTEWLFKVIALRDDLPAAIISN